MSNSPHDNYGFFGPDYSYADNIPLPGQIGVRTESSIGAIVDSVAGVNTYVDIIGFGQRTFFDHQNLKPMGIRYFMDTGTRCSNGASMSEYFDGVTKGDLLGERVQHALESAGLPGLKGLAPGMLENARDALDPRPIFSAITATGYPVCQQVDCPVGDAAGSIKNPSDDTPFILDPVTYKDGAPYQRRWVQAYDKTGAALQITKDEFAATPKCYNPDGSYMENPPAGCSRREAPPQSAPGDKKGRYRLCTVVQPVSSPRTEGFRDGPWPDVGVTVGVALIAGIALWSVLRKN